MTIEEMYCRWAERKYGIPSVERVEFVVREGWAGSDVTPGEPAHFSVRVTSASGIRDEYEDVELVPELIREIVEFALAVEPDPS